MIAGKSGRTLLSNMVVSGGQMRFMSAASSASIKSRFEAAYVERMEQTKGKGATQQAPQDKEKYGSSYYHGKVHQFSQGYQHPYHTEDNPLVFGSKYYMRILMDAVGPEQVSPHYETLSRSRRGLIIWYLYMQLMVMTSLQGGYDQNDWWYALLHHHEYLIALYVGFSEVRHHTFVPGPKFSNFYLDYTQYEWAQCINQWSDVTEQAQAKHLIHTKEQLEYVRINSEYDFVKKRALVNFLSNSRNDVERHFHTRAHTMLKSIERFEGSNLKGLLNSISTGAVEKLNAALADPVQRKEIQEASFQSALAGIRSGTMTYENDPILPILQNEIEARSAELKGLSPAEESKLLELTADQKRIIADTDRSMKADYLKQSPQISNPGLKMHPKFKDFVASIGGGGH